MQLYDTHIIQLVTYNFCAYTYIYIGTITYNHSHLLFLAPQAATDWTQYKKETGDDSQGRRSSNDVIEQVWYPQKPL